MYVFTMQVSIDHTTAGPSLTIGAAHLSAALYLYKRAAEVRLDRRCTQHDEVFLFLLALVAADQSLYTTISPKVKTEVLVRSRFKGRTDSSTFAVRFCEGPLPTAT